MKKSKEYATEILEVFVNGTEKETHKKAAAVIKELFGEATEIQSQRRITRYEPMLNVLKEQHIKWLSICRHVNKEINLLNERAFLDVIEEKMTMIYPNLIQKI